MRNQLAPGSLLLVAALLSGCGLFQRNNVQSYGSSTLAPAPTRDIDTASRLRIAQAAESAGNLDIALSMYGAAAAAEPSRPDVQARFAAVLSRTGQTARAEQVLSQALERNPNDGALLTQLGRHRLRSGSAEQALGLFDRVLARDARNADALDGRGVALDLLDRPSEAQQAYRAGLVVAPSDLRLVGNLAFSYLLEGRAQEARDVLEPHAGRSEMPARMRTSLAIARSMTGSRDAAMALLGPDVTGQDLDQLVASLPAARAAVRSRGAQALATAPVDAVPVAAAVPLGGETFL